MQVSQMEGRTGRPVANQFILSEEGRGANGNFITKEVFQSYDSLIVERITWSDSVKIRMDEHYWNYSSTTSKYRNKFLGLTTKETKAKIDSGEIQLTNLN